MLCWTIQYKNPINFAFRYEQQWVVIGYLKTMHSVFASSLKEHLSRRRHFWISIKKVFFRKDLEIHLWCWTRRISEIRKEKLSQVETFEKKFRIFFGGKSRHFVTFNTLPRWWWWWIYRPIFFGPCIIIDLSWPYLI